MENILNRLRAEVGETAFQSWLRPMRVHRVDADVVQISVPTRFMRDWAAAHYQDRLTELWHGENVAITGVEIVVHADVADGRDACAAKMEPEAPSVVTGARERDALSAPLDERFTLINSWSASRTVRLTARRIGEASTVPSIPCFLWQGSVRRTMHAIARHVREATPERSVLYLSAEKFMQVHPRASRAKHGRLQEQFRSRR